MELKKEKSLTEFRDGLRWSFLMIKREYRLSKNMVLRKEKNYPVFESGLQAAYLKFDVRTAIDRMKTALTNEERTKVNPILLRAVLRNLA